MKDYIGRTAGVEAERLDLREQLGGAAKFKIILEELLGVNRKLQSGSSTWSGREEERGRRRGGKVQDIAVEKMKIQMGSTSGWRKWKCG